MIPKHYDIYPEPLEVIQGWNLPFALGNVIKYIARAGKKSPNSAMDDLLKATDYLVRHIADESRIDEKPFCIEFYPEPAIGTIDDWPRSDNIFYPITDVVGDSEVIDDYRRQIHDFVEFERESWKAEGIENANFDGSPVSTMYLLYRDWALTSELAPLPQRTFIELFRKEANLGLVFRARKAASFDERECD